MNNREDQEEIYFFMSCGDNNIFFFEVQGGMRIRYNTLMIGLLLSANLIMIGSYLFNMKTIPPQIPLLYSLPIGEDQLVEWWMIFIIPIIMNVFYLLNSYVYNKFFFQEQFERVLLRYTNIVVISICTYLFIRIIFLVS